MPGENLTTLIDSSGTEVKLGGNEYKTVAASVTDQTLGATGAIGDYLGGLLIIPATTSPGAVSIKETGGSAITPKTSAAPRGYLGRPSTTGRLPGRSTIPQPRTCRLRATLTGFF